MLKRNRKAEVTQDALKHIEFVRKQAKECLSDPKFKKYKKSAIEAKKVLIDQMIGLEMTSIESYALSMHNMASNIRGLIALLEEIENDIPKETDNE